MSDHLQEINQLLRDFRENIPQTPIKDLGGPVADIRTVTDGLWYAIRAVEKKILGEGMALPLNQRIDVTARVGQVRNALEVALLLLQDVDSKLTSTPRVNGTALSNPEA